MSADTYLDFNFSIALLFSRYKDIEFFQLEKTWGHQKQRNEK